MTIVILHGIEGHAGIHWQQWLNDELIKAGHKVIMPNLPQSQHPDRHTWLHFIKNIIDNLSQDEEIILVGHSLGVITALDFIETSKRKISKLISVSGFAKPTDNPLNDYFMKEKTTKFKKVLKNLKSAVVIYGTKDPYVPQKILSHLAKKLKVEPIIIKDGGHLNTESGFTRFPQILSAIID